MELSTVTIDKIIVGENIRKDITKESLSSLIISLKEKGILQPLLVRKNGSKIDLLDGHRRFSAAKYAGLTEIPVLSVDAEKNDRVEYQLVANLQRKDLNPIDEALAYKSLGENYKAKDIMVITGKSEYRVKRILSLLDLCDEVKKMIKEGKISADHGFVLTRLSDAKYQKHLANDIIRYRYSPVKAEGELENYSQRLETACFNKKDCKTCSFNGSTYDDLFDRSNSLKGKCMNNLCFSKKIREVQKEKEEAYKKKGKKVIILKTEPQYGSKDAELLKDIVDFSGYEGNGFPAEQFKTECIKTCPTFAIIIGPTGREKQVCLNRDCFKRTMRKSKAVERKAMSIKTGDKEIDASAQYEARQKANRVDIFKRQFFISELKVNAKVVQINRILLDQLFDMESGASNSISGYLGFKKDLPNYEVRGTKEFKNFLLKLKTDELLKIVEKVVLDRLSKYETKELEDLGEEAGINIGKKFRITQEYLEKFSKAGLQKLSKELKLKVGSLAWKEKKGEIIKEMLGLTKTKVPKEMIKGS